ncbi:MAG: DUF6150 family protein [Bacteroidota bacterium]|nr:DUF6150 family protein [Bacteroidota bacterium]
MNLQRLFLLIGLLLLFTSVQAKNVCIVKNRKDADICVNRTKTRAVADYVVILSKKRFKTDPKVWVITEQKDAELKVYFSTTPEKIKVFISKNQADGV